MAAGNKSVCRFVVGTFLSAHQVLNTRARSRNLLSYSEFRRRMISPDNPEQTAPFHGKPWGFCDAQATSGLTGPYVRCRSSRPWKERFELKRPSLPFLRRVVSTDPKHRHSASKKLRCIEVTHTAPLHSVTRQCCIGEQRSPTCRGRQVAVARRPWTARSPPCTTPTAASGKRVLVRIRGTDRAVFLKG